MRTALQSDMSLPESKSKPMPPLELTERCNELELAPNMVRVLVFGGDYHADLISQAFMHHQHVMIVKGTVCMIAPPYQPWQETLNRLEQVNAG